MQRRVCRFGFWRRLTGLLVVGVLVAAGCGGGSDEVSVPATTSLVKNVVLTTSTSAPAPTTTQAPTTTTVPLVEVPDLVGQTVDFAEGVLSVIGLVLVVDASGATISGKYGRHTESYTLYEGRGTKLHELHSETVQSHLAALSTLGFVYETVARKAGFVTQLNSGLSFCSIPDKTLARFRFHLGLQLGSSRNRLLHAIAFQEKLRWKFRAPKSRQ